MTDLEFQIVLSLREIPQRQRHFRLLGEEHAAAAQTLLRRGLIERTDDANYGASYRLTVKGRQQAHTEWIHRGKPSLEEVLKHG